MLVACPRIYGKCEKYLNYSSRTENVTVHNCHYRCKKTRIDTKTTDRTLLEKTFEKSDVAKGHIAFA